MKALQFLGPNRLALRELDRPRLGSDEVLVAPRAVGICHSDFELLEGRYIIPFDYPIIPGHEWAGEVVEVGSDVTTLDVGDRVLGECVIQSKQLKVRGNNASPGVWPHTLRFLARSGLDLSPMVTATFSLDRAEDAYQAARRTDVNIKVQIHNPA